MKHIRQLRCVLGATVLATGTLLVVTPVASAAPTQQPEEDCPPNKTCLGLDQEQGIGGPGGIGSGNQVSLPLGMPIQLCAEVSKVEVSEGNACEGDPP